MKPDLFNYNHPDEGGDAARKAVILHGRDEAQWTDFISYTQPPVLCRRAGHLAGR